MQKSLDSLFIPKNPQIIHFTSFELKTNSEWSFYLPQIQNFPEYPIFLYLNCYHTKIPRISILIRKSLNHPLFTPLKTENS